MEGACVILSDNDPTRLKTPEEEFKKEFGKDSFASALMDVSNNGHVEYAMKTSALEFGGVDILVNNAGLSISKPLEDHSEDDWDLVYDVLVKGQFLTTEAP